MEAVHELEAQRDEQGDEQQRVRQEGGEFRAGGVDVGIDAVDDVEEPRRRQAEEDDERERLEPLSRSGRELRAAGSIGGACKAVSVMELPRMLWRGVRAESQQHDDSIS